MDLVSKRDLEVLERRVKVSESRRGGGGGCEEGGGDSGVRLVCVLKKSRLELKFRGKMRAGKVPIPILNQLTNQLHAVIPTNFTVDYYHYYFYLFFPVPSCLFIF